MTPLDSEMGGTTALVIDGNPASRSALSACCATSASPRWCRAPGPWMHAACSSTELRHRGL